MTDTQKRYSTYDLHRSQATSNAFCQDPEKASPQQVRQLSFIAEFCTKIEHISGAANTVADALSRIEGIDQIDMDEGARLQEADDELNRLLRDVETGKSSLQLRKLQLTNFNISVYCDVFIVTSSFGHIFRCRCERPYSTCCMVWLTLASVPPSSWSLNATCGPALTRTSAHGRRRVSSASVAIVTV